MKKIYGLMLTFIMVFSLGACGKDNDSLIGNWTTMAEDNDGKTVSREFKDDGTVIERVSFNLALRVDGTYTIRDNMVTLNMTDIVDEETGKSIPCEVNWEFSYSIKGNKLTLVDLNRDYEEVIYARD